MLDLDTYFDKGYLIKQNLIDKNTCDEIIKFISSKKPLVNIPHSSIGWGYGNLVDNKKMEVFTLNKYINNFCKQLFGKDYVFNHLMVNNKAPWIGPDVEWHQEIFNVDTYAPGGNEDDDSWKNFIQIYIALDKHTLENGCLKVIPESHKLGLLAHEDALNNFLNHKRRIPCDVMNKVYKKLGIKNLIMDRGDVLFFNHRFIHGSSSNNSPFERRSIVLQARKKLIRDEQKFLKETSYRKNFIIDVLNQKLDKLTNKNIFNSFNKSK